MKNSHSGHSGLMERRIGGVALATQVGAPASEGSAYVWLAERIERLVADGRLTHDTRLPGEREAAAALGLSRTTVTHAYARLRERGFAEARHGSGTRVRIPGGPVTDGGEPLRGILGSASGDAHAGEPGVINMTNASPAAVAGLGERFVDAARRIGAYTHGGGYYRDGIPDLRTVLADRYTAAGAPTSPEQIIVTTGALSGLAATASALLAPGARVAVEPSGYPNALASLRSRGARLVPVPEAADESALDLPGLDDVLARHRPTAMLVTPDFHNPTGRLVPDADRRELARTWKRHGVTGVVDETLADLWWDERPDARPMAAFAPGCITVGSASKTYWGGLRLGWVRAPRSLVGAIASARVTLDLGAPVLEQIVLAGLLHDEPGVDADRRAQLARRRVLLRDSISAACPGWACEVPRGGLSLWWRLPRPASTRLVARARERGLALTPGSAFSCDGRGLEARLRTPFTLPDEQLLRAAQILGEVEAGPSR